MRNNLLKTVLTAGILSAMVVACRQDDLPVVNEEAGDDPPAPTTDGMTQLGKKLENPYSVENMRKAWKNLQAIRGAACRQDPRLGRCDRPDHFFTNGVQSLGILFLP